MAVTEMVAWSDACGRLDHLRRLSLAAAVTVTAEVVGAATDEGRQQRLHRPTVARQPNLSVDCSLLRNTVVKEALRHAAVQCT